MQTELNSSSATQSSAQNVGNQGFDQMAQSLSQALSDFSKDSPAFLSSIVSALRPIGDYSIQAWTTVTSYVRRHPVQAAVGVVALGFIAAQVMKRRSMTSSSLPQTADGRQY